MKRTFSKCGLHCRLYSQLWMKPHFRHLFICDPWSMFIFRPFFPSSLWNDISHITHLIYLLYIAGKSWIIVISSLLPLQSDFLWFLIISPALQKWFPENLNVFYFIPPPAIKPCHFCLTTNLNLLPCQTLMWSIIFSISCVIVTHFVHHLNLSTFVLNVHLRYAI